MRDKLAMECNLVQIKVDRMRDIYGSEGKIEYSNVTK